MTRLPTPLHQAYAREAASFDPMSAQALRVWLPSTGRYYTEQARETVAGVDDRVGSWSDLSGALRHGEQGSGGARPTVLSLGPSLSFNAAHKVVSTIPDHALTDGIGFMGVHWFAAMTELRTIWALAKDGAAHPYVALQITTGGELRIAYSNDAGAAASADSASPVDVGVHSVALETDGADMVAWVDTVEVARITPVGTITGLNRLVVGALEA